MNFRIMTFYTQKTPYEQEAKNLEQDCQKIRIPFTSYPMKPHREWVENTMRKPEMILNAMMEIKEDYIIWVDADARIKSYPDFFDFVAKRKYDWGIFVMGSESRITSGTIAIRRNINTIAFITDWLHRCQTATQRRGDQQCLRELIKDGGYQTYKLKWTKLPYSYCYIFDDSLRKLAPAIPPLFGPPVIVHTQASRRYKEK